MMSGSDTSPAATQVARVQPGLSVLRYASATDAAAPPYVTVTVANAAPGRVRLVSAPGEPEGVLSGPGTALAIVAEVPAELVLKIFRGPATRSIAAEVKLELLAGARQAAAAADIRRPLPNVAVESGAIQVLGHLAHRGDVVVSGGEWLGGPEFPSRIEGVEVRWPGMPAGLGLEYVTIVGDRTPRTLPPCQVGQFAGTRRQAMPVTGLALTLKGENASHYQLRVDALFLGSPVVSRSGQSVSLAGPGGREPLVGLRLAVEAADQKPLPAIGQDRVPADARPIESGRVRIFRSSRA